MLTVNVFKLRIIKKLYFYFLKPFFLVKVCHFLLSACLNKRKIKINHWSTIEYSFLVWLFNVIQVRLTICNSDCCQERQNFQSFSEKKTCWSSRLLQYERFFQTCRLRSISLSLQFHDSEKVNPYSF